jgi:hypothetical protein
LLLLSGVDEANVAVRIVKAQENSRFQYQENVNWREYEQTVEGRGRMISS